MITDDVTLLKLSEEPEKELFPLLRAAPAMSHLVIVLAILPGLPLFFDYVPTGDHVQWGLDALQVEGVHDRSEARFSPLATWLIAAMLRSGPRAMPNTLVAVSFAMHIASVVLVYRVGSVIHGRRLGLLAAAIAAFHRAMLLQIATPAPLAFGSTGALLAVYGYLRHTQSSKTTLSLQLLLSGLGLGVCVLTAGPLALAVIAILGLGTLLNLTRPHAVRRNGSHSGRGAHSELKPLRSLGGLLLTAFAVAGWWVLRNASHEHLGSAFWPHWIEAGLTVGRPSGGVFATFGFLAGPAFIGARRVVQGYREATERGIGASYLIAWCLISIAFPLLVVMTGFPATHNLFGLSSMAVVLLAAIGIEQILNREASYVMSLVALGVSLISANAWSLIDDPSKLQLRNSSIGVLLSLCILALIIWWELRVAAGRERHRSRFLVGIVGVFVTVNAVIGVQTPHLVGKGVKSTHSVARELSTIRSVKSCTVVGRDLSPRLKFFFAKTWPGVDVQFVSNWNSVPAAALSEETARNEPPHVIATVDSGRLPLTTPNGARIQLRSQIPPFYFEDRQLNVFTTEPAAED